MEYYLIMFLLGLLENEFQIVFEGCLLEILVLFIECCLLQIVG